MSQARRQVAPEPAREAVEGTVMIYQPNPKATGEPSRALRWLRTPVGALVPIVVVVLLWQLGSAAGVINRTFFPEPSQCFSALWHLIRDGELLPNLWISIKRIILGFLLGVIPAIVVGVSMARLPWVRAIIDPLIAVTYPIPVVAILPLLLVIFGTGSQPIIVLAGIISFFPAAVNTMSGVMQADERLVLMARNLGASRIQIMRKIVLPGALPSIFAGIRLAAGLALLGVIAGEFLASSDGIGSMTWRYWQIYQIDNMYATLIVIVAMGFLLTTLTLRIQRQFFGWTEGQK